MSKNKIDIDFLNMGDFCQIKTIDKCFLFVFFVNKDHDINKFWISNAYDILNCELKATMTLDVKFIKEIRVINNIKDMI